jgi:hypothetical protein
MPLPLLLTSLLLLAAAAAAPPPLPKRELSTAVFALG